MLAPAITRTPKLYLKDLLALNLPITVDDDQVKIQKTLRGNNLRQPLSISLDKILEAKEPGLIAYIFKSCLNDRPNLLPFIFEYKSTVKLARHFIRHCSGSTCSCRSYLANIQRYSDWLQYNPDQIIADVKPNGPIADPQRILNHCGFLNDYLAELQDKELTAASVNNAIKSVKTFYSVHSVEIKIKKVKNSRAVVYKDRAPKPEELTKLLNILDTRDAFIIAAIATGGFREGTFSKLKYRHIKEDLEAGIIPIHIYVEAEITKGKYHDYDTFINAEASELLKQYLQERRQGNKFFDPENITDESPLIRNERSNKSSEGVSEKAIRDIVHGALLKAGIIKRLPNSRYYNIRTHSLRKYFRTQMGAAKVDPEVIKYMMGKTIDTYESIQSLGIETLRNTYVSAGIAIRSKTKANKIEQLKEILRSWGENPEEILTKDALMRGNITEISGDREDRQLSLLADSLKKAIKEEVSK
jgi:site-specific recombinase XerD